MDNLRKNIESAINAASAENGSDTPDFILAEYLTDCLTAYDKAVVAREKWYGRYRKIMKTPKDPEAAETARTADSPAVVHERLVRHLFADKVFYLYSVKLLRQSRVNPNEQDRHEEFYAAQDIRDVWAGIALELADEAVEVESVTRCVPILSFLLPNASLSHGDESAR